MVSLKEKLYDRRGVRMDDGERFNSSRFSLFLFSLVSETWSKESVEFYDQMTVYFFFLSLVSEMWL